METHIETGHLVAIVVSLLLIAAAVQAITKKVHLPFTVALVLVGIALNQLAHNGLDFLEPLTEYALSPDVILFVFLPTLIYESAFNLNARQLKHNIIPVLLLAIPGLILSTLIIGGVLALFTPIPFPAALLLGSILSATDPVAVIALFKQLGAPKRLTVLVEGESLFNDATAIVASRVLIGIVAAGYFSWESLAWGLADFFLVFIGGAVAGWLMALITGWLLSQVESDPFIEISLTTVLAYFSFLVAEEWLHVSGVMATVAAGITMGGWGRTKISPSVEGYMEHFWEYMASVANALIFVLVGLRVNLDAVAHSLDILPLLIVAMLLARAAVIYGLVPIAGRFAAPVDRRYQTVMFWGGLRGAIALAIALSLGDMPYADTFVVLVTGAVLFTLLVQGLTIEPLVHKLGLDQPSLAERVSRTEGLLEAKQRALKSLPDLRAGGLFSARIADTLERNTQRELDTLRRELTTLRSGELTEEEEKRLLLLRCTAAEKTFYYDLYTKGHLSERAYRNLSHSIDVQQDALRQGLPLPPFTLHPPNPSALIRWLLAQLDKLFAFTGIPERLRASRIADDYDEAWGRYRSCEKVLADLSTIAQDRVGRAAIVDEVRKQYHRWYHTARQRIDETAAQFPEFVNAMQERLAGRLLVSVQQEIIAGETQAGTLPSGVAASVNEELNHQVRQLRGEDLSQLKVEPAELLRKVPFFSNIPGSEFDKVAEALQPLTVREGELIISQGEKDDTLYLIARGVVRVSLSQNDQELDLATLIGGDFFGEMALLHSEPRTASCRAVTPCALYALKRIDFDRVREVCPAIQSALEEADEERSAALDQK